MTGGLAHPSWYWSPTRAASAARWAPAECPTTTTLAGVAPLSATFWVAWSTAQTTSSVEAPGSWPHPPRSGTSSSRPPPLTRRAPRRAAPSHRGRPIASAHREPGRRRGTVSPQRASSRGHEHLDHQLGCTRGGGRGPADGWGKAHQGPTCSRTPRGARPTRLPQPASESPAAQTCDQHPPSPPTGPPGRRFAT